MPSELRVSIASTSDRSDWDQFVARHGDDTGYHAWEWQRVFEDACGYRTVYLIARRGAKVAGILPLVENSSLLFGNTLTSLPFLNYGGVLADSPEAGAALAAAARDEARVRRCGHIELRHVGSRFAGLPSKRHKVAMRLALRANLWDSLDRKLRTQISMVESSGLTVERGGKALVSDFYKVFAYNLRDVGTPVCSARWFEEMLVTFPHRALLHIVRRNGEAIAAALSYRTPTLVQLPWTSSIRDFHSLSPNVLLYWDAIQFAQSVGATTFDMGLATSNEATRFKAQWGAKAVPLNWEYQLLTDSELPNVSTARPRFEQPHALWQRLSLSLRGGPKLGRVNP